MKKKVPDKRKEPIKRARYKSASCACVISLMMFVFLAILIVSHDLP